MANRKQKRKLKNSKGKGKDRSSQNHLGVKKAQSINPEKWHPQKKKTFL